MKSIQIHDPNNSKFVSKRDKQAIIAYGNRTNSLLGQSVTYTTAVWYELEEFLSFISLHMGRGDAYAETYGMQ